MAIATNQPNSVVLFLLTFVKPPFPQTTYITIFIIIIAPLPLLKLSPGTKKEVQKDQDTNKAATSSPKRIMTASTKLQSPGI